MNEENPVEEWIALIAAVHLERYENEAGPVAVYLDRTNARTSAMMDLYIQKQRAAGTLTDDADTVDTSDDALMAQCYREAEPAGIPSEDLLEEIRAGAFWGYADAAASPPVIHYWRRASTVGDAEPLCMFFAAQLTEAVFGKFEDVADLPPGFLFMLPQMVAAIAARARRLAVGSGEPEPGK